MNELIAASTCSGRRPRRLLGLAREESRRDGGHYNVVNVEAAGALRAPAPVSATPLASLLTGHVLRDGEVVLLICKPSLWYIILTSLRWAAAIAILLVAVKIYDERLPGRNSTYIEAGIFAIAGRVMWAVLQWMGRLYVLTDLRILRLDGIFSVELFDCPLRKVARTRIVHTTRERIVRLGTIEIIPSDEKLPVAQWQMVARPRAVHDQIISAVNRAKQGGCPS